MRLTDTWRRRRVWLVGAALVAVLALAIPIETTVVPAWTVMVVDELGTPLPGVAVNCHWQDYSLESEGHEERTSTDRDGKVAFPSRRIRASTFSRLIGPVRNVVELGVHASFGPSGQLVMYGKRGFKTGGATYRGHGQPPPVVVLKKEDA